jgi:hypothetical protein
MHLAGPDVEGDPVQGAHAGIGLAHVDQSESR